MLISKSYTYQSFRVKPLEISYSSVDFFSDRDEVLLVSEEFVLTELYEISNGFTRRDWQVQDFELSITWKLFLSISSTPFNSTVFPVTPERENETTKTKVFTLHNPRMNIQVSKVTPISSLSKSSGEPKSSAEEIHFQGSTSTINIKLLIDLQNLCTLTNILVP